MNLLNNIKSFIAAKANQAESSTKNAISSGYSNVSRYAREKVDAAQDKTQSALGLDTIARFINPPARNDIITVGNGISTPSPSPVATPVPDAAAKPKRLGSTSKSASRPDEYYYSRVKNDQAKGLIKKYAEMYNIDPAVAVAFAGHETGDTFDPLQPNLGGDGGTGLFQATPSVNHYAAAVLKQDPNRQNPELWTDAGAQQLRDDLMRAEKGAFYKNPNHDEFKYLKDAYQMFNGGPGYAKKNPEKVKQVQYNGEKFMKYYNGILN